MSNASSYPLITIGVSAYNRADYLPQCLDSLLAQTYPRCEIIVIDDGSTDNTAELMQSKYPQIKYVYQPNGGDAAAKNHAARIASGEYIVFNDSDDIFFPDAVERLYNALPENKLNACSYGTYQTINAEGKELPTKNKVKKNPSGNITRELLKHIFVYNCGTLVPRKAIINCGGFDESLRTAYDWSLFLEMSLSCNFYAVQEPVFYRRRHGSNLSSATYKKMHITWRVFENFLAKHPDIQEKYRSLVKSRRADLNAKLYREAMREKLYQQAFEHAVNAWQNKKSVKNLCNFGKAAVSKLIKAH